MVDQELSAYCSGNLLLADETELHRVRFGFRSTEVNKKMMVHFAVTGFPLFVPDGWAAELFRIPGAKVTLRWGRVEQEEACRRLDHAIMELTMQARGKASKVIDRTTHMESLSALLADIQKNQETLLDAVFIITTPDRKRVQKKLRQLGLEFTECYGLQREIFSFLQPGGGLEPSLSVSLSFSGLAAGFPFDSDIKQDEDGILLGENELPVFFNPFRTDEEYLNRNLMVIGKSGSGKSYAMKSLLAQLSTCEAKIFVLDPEGEYSALARNLYGQVIDVSNGEQGKINPFHIFPSLEDQDNGNYSGSYYAHLQFLEKFFLLTLPVSGDDMELLNQMVAACYRGKKIDEHTNLSALRAEDYPTFEDLRSMMEMNASKGTAEQKAHLNRLLDHVKKFCRGGRFSNLWNGPTCLKARENFVCFDFQKLMANRNEQMANAQMLLVLKYLEGEIIRNREYCLQSRRKQEVVVAVDEAHVFVDENFPVALDFMYQLAKRIRKYNGMLIVATQSLQDFVGSRENLRKSMAIVNAAQYSMIFSLSPKDLSDLCRLYENAGGINEAEKQWIMQSQRGEAYLIASSRQRHRLRVVASDYIENMNGGSV